MRTATIETSLRIRAVWPGFSLFATQYRDLIEDIALLAKILSRRVDAQIGPGVRLSTSRTDPFSYTIGCNVFRIVPEPEVFHIFKYMFILSATILAASV